MAQVISHLVERRSDGNLCGNGGTAAAIAEVVGGGRSDGGGAVVAVGVASYWT